MKIGQTISQNELKTYEHISTFGNYEIFHAIEDVEYLFAIDSNNLICSCFEFVDYDEYIQLAHMNTIPNLKGFGIGKFILKEAVKIYDSFKLPSVDTADIYYFVEDGLGWIKHCFQIGILNPSKFREPNL